MSNDEVDVLIVGAGAAGSVMAAHLAEAGHSVLVLEAGPERALEDLYSSQIWARRLKWGAPHIADKGAGSIWFNFNAGHGVGGAAIHHYAVWPRFRPEDFREQTLYGKGCDWPLSYDELRPYYDRVQGEVGMAGDAAAEADRPPGDPYPLPPAPLFAQARVLAEGFTALGLRTVPTPMAILTQPYNGRNACLWDGWCDAGCPIGALANPLVVYLPRALKHGAQLQADSRVLRVLTDAQGERATGVEYVHRGTRRTQRAKLVIIAAFSVETPRILLNSATTRHKNGLGNDSGTLGRYLMGHASVGVYGMFAQDMQNHLGVAGGQLLCQDRFPKRGNPAAFGSRQWALALALKPNDLLGIAMTRADLFGVELDTFMRRAARNLGNMVAICEDQPLADNRVELATETDTDGVPRAQVVYRPSDEAAALAQEAGEEGIKIMKAAGATDAWKGPVGCQHIMGGVRMGADPHSSVTDSFGRVHAVRNLFVAGPSLFPTSSSGNITFTVHALAARAAQFIASHWQAL